MPVFTYRAITAEGEASSGETTAADEIAALDRLASAGLTVIDLREGRDEGPWWAREIGPPGGGALPARDLARLPRTLATLLGAGFAVPAALAFCADETQAPRPRRILTRMRGVLEEGGTLEAAMEAEGAAFPEAVRAVIGLGERANRLAETAAAAADRIAAEERIRRELRGALLYPMILAGMSVLVLALLVFFLAPTLLPVFASTGQPPPRVLAALDGVRTLLLRDWPAVLVALGLGAGALWLVRGRLRRGMQALVLRLPFAGGWVRQRESARLVGTLRLLIASGAPLDLALRSAAAATPHPRYARLLRETEGAVASGAPLGASLAEGGLLDPMALALLRAGEEADALPATLAAAEAALTEAGTARLSAALKLLAPVLTLAIGAGVAGLILSVIGAILDLNDAAC